MPAGAKRNVAFIEETIFVGPIQAMHYHRKYHLWHADGCLSEENAFRS